MAKRKSKSGITADEQFTIDDVAGAFEQIAEFMDGQSEVPTITELGFDARVALLKRVHTILGDEGTRELIELLEMSNDADFRSPK
jgi:hypothetical protein